MSTNRWLIVVVAVLALQVLTSLRLVIGTTDLTAEIGKTLRHVEPPGSVRTQDVGVDTTRPYLGDPNSPVRLVIFSDFQCPACAELASQISALHDQFDEKLCISYRYHPLSSHSRARQLAELGAVARRLGVFWAFHDSLFSRQADLDDAGLASVCRSLGFEPKVTGADQKAVDADLEIAEKLEVGATPMMFINGRQVIGAYPLTILEQIITEELRSPLQRPALCEE